MTMPNASVLRSLRESRGLSLTELARRVGIGVSRYYMIEAGKRPAPPKVAEAIARELGTDCEALFLPISFTVRQTGEVAG